MSEEQVTLPKATVQILIDLALYGDAGMSGWMGDEEVNTLRSVAEVIGVDPMDVTPRAFKCKHRNNVHDLGGWYDMGWKHNFQQRRCKDCGFCEGRTPPNKSGDT